MATEVASNLPLHDIVGSSGRKATRANVGAISQSPQLGERLISVSRLARGEVNAERLLDPNGAGSRELSVRSAGDGVPGPRPSRPPA
jgi:hypothetical protein